LHRTSSARGRALGARRRGRTIFRRLRRPVLPQRGPEQRHRGAPRLLPREPRRLTRRPCFSSVRIQFPMTPSKIPRPSVALVGLFAAALLALAPLSASAGVLFQDNFNNGTAADSDSVSGYWTLVTPNSASSGSTVTESNGALTI